MLEDEKFNNNNHNNRQDLDNLKEWLKKQLHLPQNIDEHNLRKFLFSCDNSLEKTKNLIDLCFTLRSQAPEIFANRDPENVDLKEAFNTIDYVPLPKLTPQKYKLFVYRLKDGTPDKFVYSDALKAFFMVADLRMYTNFEESDGEVPIFDMAGFTLKHLTKVNLPILRKYMTYTQEAHPVRLKQIHVINIPPFLDHCLTLVRPFMKSEVARLVKFHAPNSKTLFDYIPKELIPEEYGGTLGNLERLSAEWRQKISDNRDFFMDETRWKVDERKRPTNGINNKHEIYDMQGSFRSLSID